MSTLKRLHRQAKNRRSGRPAFTLLELIVVLLVLGILAAIAVPTFNRVKENSVERAAQTTLEAIDRNGEAIAFSDPGLSDAAVAAAALAEVSAPEGMTITRNTSGDGKEVTVEYTNGGIVASGKVAFADGVGTITPAAVSGGSSGTTSTTAAPTTTTTVAPTWSLVVHDQPSWITRVPTITNVSYNPTTKFLSYSSSWGCNDSGYSTIKGAGVDQYLSQWSQTGAPAHLQFSRNGEVYATRSDNSTTTGCNYTVDFAAVERAEGVTFTNTQLQTILLNFHNESWDPRPVKLLLS